MCLGRSLAVSFVGCLTPGMSITDSSEATLRAKSAWKYTCKQVSNFRGAHGGGGSLSKGHSHLFASHLGCLLIER